MLSKSSEAHNRRLYLLRQLPLFGAVLAKDLSHMGKVEHRAADLAGLAAAGLIRVERVGGGMPRYRCTWRGMFRGVQESYTDPRAENVTAKPEQTP